ncbi:MAG TPA: WD40 repeat domain-containing protein, partial [Phototrophicaceae bacterium]|nr:WD40 repeat domain-containing protein [Phototrophicaceae bacterium]
RGGHSPPLFISLPDINGQAQVSRAGISFLQRHNQQTSINKESIMRWLFRFTLLLVLFVIVSLTTISSPVTAQLSENITSLAWSPDGNKVAGGDINSDVYIWDAADFTLLTYFHAQTLPVYSITWNPESTQIAVTDATAGTITVWDVRDGKPLIQLSTTPLTPGISARGYVAWSKQGVLANVSFVDEGLDHVHLWDMTGDQFIERTLKAQAVPFSLTWNPDGTRLAISDQFSVYVFNDLSKDILPASIGAFSLGIAWKPDGSQLASIYPVQPDASVDILSIPDGKVVKSFKNNEDSAAGIAWSPDGRKLAIHRSSGMVEIRDVDSGQIQASFQLDMLSGQRIIIWSPFGGRIVVGSTVKAIENQTTPLLPEHVQSSGENQLRVIVPIASLDWLTKIASYCLQAVDNPSPKIQDFLSPETMLAFTLDQLPDFIDQIKELPSDAIPSACAADLVAVAEALITS